MAETTNILSRCTIDQKIKKSILLEFFYYQKDGFILHQVFVERRLIKLAAAVPADVAVVPWDYVVRIAVRTSIHYAALHW